MKTFFRYASCCEKAMMVVGSFSALIAGALLPAISIVMGAIINVFGPESNEDEVLDNMRQIIGIIMIAGTAQLVFTYLFYAFWQHVAENVAFSLRSRYLKALLNQEIAYFEQQQIESLPSLISEYFSTIQIGIGEKFASVIMTAGAFLSGFVIAFYFGVIFALICLAYYPIIILFGVLFGKAVKKSQFEKLGVLNDLGAIVEESLSSIRVISSFNQEHHELERFMRATEKTRSVAFNSERRVAIMYGFFAFFLFGFYVYAFWIGGVLIGIEYQNINFDDMYYDAAAVLVILLGMMMGLVIVVSLGPNISAVTKAKAVGAKVFEVIDRVPEIKDETNALSSFTLNSHIEFQNVSFKYPTDRSAKAVKADTVQKNKVHCIEDQNQDSQKFILKNSNFKIKKGSSTAIVGPSGSGKSTIVQLIERFYTPNQGEITFDNTNIKDIKLETLRESIGYVSQEPVLIMGSIKDNLLFGKNNATDQEIKEALEMSNALFAYNIDPKLEASIGSGSIVALSGGQKQRIAIARALIKKPKILILDEATSALDSKSEREVQQAINHIEQQNDSLTIIMIAHRFQTIETASNLIYLQDPFTQIQAEKGTPEYAQILAKLREADDEEDVKKHEPESFEEPVIPDVGTARKQDNNDLEEVSMREDDNHDLYGPIEQKPISLKPHRQVKVEVQNEDKAEVLEGKKPTRLVTLGQIMQHYNPKWVMVVSVITSFLASFVYPLYALIFTNLLFTLSGFKGENNSDPGTTQAEIDNESDIYFEDLKFWCLMALYLCLFFAFTLALQKLTFSYTSENLVEKVRNMLFEGIVYKAVSWFDDESTAPGILSNTLSEDIALLNGLTTETIAILIQGFSGLAVGVAFSMYYSWRIALMTLGVAPFIIVGGAIRGAIQQRELHSNDDVSKLYQQSNALLSDIIMNYRTVIGFGPNNVAYLMAKYQNMLIKPNSRAIKNAHYGGLAFGYINGARYYFQALVFFLGALVVSKFHEDSHDVYTSVFLLIMAAMGSGLQLQNAPSMAKAKIAASKIWSIIDEPSAIDVRNQVGETRIGNGEIKFENVQFHYPSRPNQKVLKSINLDFPANKKIALVGHSGCGKSTIANLLLRFYDIQSGSITIDGTDLRQYKLSELRKHIGIVMQEPMIFNMSIKENILYGKADATNEEIKKAAELANALQFIEDENQEREEFDFAQATIQNLTDKEFQNCLMKLNEMKMYEGGTLVQLEKKIYELSTNKYQACLLQRCFIELMQNQRRLDALWERIKSISDFLKQVEALGKSEGLNSMLLLELSWQQEALTLLGQSNDFQIGNQFKLAINQDFLNINKFRVDLEMLKNWANEIDSLEVGDQNLLNFEDGKSILYKLVQENGSSVEEKWLELKKKLDQKDYKPIITEGGLSPGFDRNCGLKGSYLSGGQKQRIAIARAIIRDPKILILDEATSALDDRNQEIVQNALDQAMKGRTSIVIAHRLSTIENCDWIFVFQQGDLVEEGTYQQLSNDKNSEFSKLKAGMQADK